MRTLILCAIVGMTCQGCLAAAFSAYSLNSRTADGLTAECHAKIVEDVAKRMCEKK